MVGVHTSNGFLESDVVVLAAGAGVPELCNPLGCPVPVTSLLSILIQIKSMSRRKTDQRRLVSERSTRCVAV